MQPTEQKLKALEAFKDWSNYLLITTVAALGWTASKDALSFLTPGMKPWAIVCFAGSIIFAILTLALIPHVAEDLRDDHKTIYEVYWRGWLVELRLTRLCFPQHLLFLLGIVLYATGMTFNYPQSAKWAAGIVGITLVMIFVAGHLPRVKNTKAQHR
jgi:hypothetical protein